MTAENQAPEGADARQTTAQQALRDLAGALIEAERPDIAPCPQDLSQKLVEMAKPDSPLGVLRAALAAQPQAAPAALTRYTCPWGCGWTGTDDHATWMRHHCRPVAQPPAEGDDLCERICAAIKAADDKSMAEAEYMLDCNDCIRIVREQFAACRASKVQPKETQS